MLIELIYSKIPKLFDENLSSISIICHYHRGQSQSFLSYFVFKPQTLVEIKGLDGIIANQWLLSQIGLYSFSLVGVFRRLGSVH